MRLSGDVAIVTGASSGIGRATALLFAKEGAKVVCIDRQQASRFPGETPDTVTAICNAGGEAIYVETDVADSQQVNHAVEVCLHHFGKVNILVNCAGIFVRNSITDVSDEEWMRVLSINLSGYFYFCRAVVPYMKAQNEGRIVNISSIHGIRGTATAATYCASKGGIENLTKQLAMEFAPFKIRVNAVTPGTIETAMCKPFLDTPELRTEYEKRTLLPRLGVPDDVAYCALFLASHESSYVVGHSLVVDGGWTIT
jgi:NAD(P)-dependent dehydrogenase (short-subunit alcohol dehydrogenase family)